MSLRTPTALALTLALAACQSNLSQQDVEDDVPDGFADPGAEPEPDAQPEPESMADAGPPPDDDGDNVSQALAFGESLVGTPYGWWYEGPLPKGEPMWTAEGPPPGRDQVRARSANCTGLTNLMLRAVGQPLPFTREGGRGGTYSYAEYFAEVAQPFDPSRRYPAGTLIGRRYRDTFDQGHVAVVLADGRVLQSFAWERGGSTPGVNTTYTVAESHDGGFYEYAVMPADWLGGPSQCAWGDGNYCGENGVTGDANTLYVCKDGVAAELERCAAGCVAMPPGESDRCAE